jgi:cell wall-associated NlpC family hydrolase
VDDVGTRAFAAAEAMLGVRFRLQGRDGRFGLDCVGLVWAAYAAAGVRLIAPADYPLRGWSAARVVRGLEASGLSACDDEGLAVGDVALLRLAAGQFHLGILGAGHVVHAHAGLRRVVAVPMDAAWRAAERWRWGD